MSEESPMAAKTEPVEPQSFDLTVEEFCTRKSQGDKRVELLAAFCASERRTGKVKDSEKAYEARYAAFADKPA